MTPKKTVRVKWLHAHMGREVGVPMEEDSELAERFKSCGGLEILDDEDLLEVPAFEEEEA